MTAPRRICTRCVMDTSDPDITFDAQGVCNFCNRFRVEVAPKILSPEAAKSECEALLRKIRDAGRGQPYDCILGLSGGLDSSYLAYIAMKHGLRPLLVHLDNSWDSELAVKNIENIVRKTGFDYYNFVVDWEEFRDLQVAFLKAGVVDVEVVADQMIFALLYRTANERGIKHILSGENYSIEGALSGRGWNYLKFDGLNLRDIHRRFGRVPLHSYRPFSHYEYLYYFVGKGIERVRLLDATDYSFHKAIEVLGNEFDWRYYGEKHYESVFTRFYQAYILPRKFGRDKRTIHYSCLIQTGQMTRAEALERLARPLYEEANLKADYDYVIKKLGFTRDEFESIMNEAPVEHHAYAHEIITPYHLLKVKLWRLLYAPYKWEHYRSIPVAVGRLAAHLGKTPSPGAAR